MLGQPLSFSLLGRRERQEDARYPDNDAPSDSCPAFVVCDGVGGSPGGDAASSTVAAAIGTEAARGVKFTDALEAGYRALDQAGKSYGHPIATTLAMAVFSNDGVLVAHAGDSRVYQVRPGVGIVHQTQDHSLVNMMVHAGELTPQEAAVHPKSNIVTRCMVSNAKGDARSVETFLTADIQEGDYFFLCSDGVWHSVSTEDLTDILSASVSDNDKMAELEKACESSSDNATAILIRVAAVVHDIRPKFADKSLRSKSFFKRVLSWMGMR